MKVNILGTEYEILSQSPKEKGTLGDAHGVCDNYSLQILTIDEIEKDEMTVGNIDEYMKKVLRHEIVHAFMFQSGLDVNSEWGRDETLVDWIALQIPKMVNAMKQANCL